MSEEEETKQQFQTLQDNAQTTIETGVLSKEQNNTIQSCKKQNKKRKKKPSELQLDIKNSFNGTQYKFKSIFDSPLLS